MTVPRVVILLVALVLVGVAAVAIRIDQRRCARQIQQLQFHEIDLKQTIWTQEMQLARLRSPRLIQDRAPKLGLDTPLADADGVSKRKP